MAESNWSERKKWIMDLLRSVVATILTFALAYSLFDRLEQGRAESRALCAQTVANMHRALAEFNGAASAYRRAADNTLIELYRWRDSQPTEPMRFFWGTGYSGLDSALRGVSVAFTGLNDDVEKMREEMTELKRMLDDNLIDPRLDDIEIMYNQPLPPSPEKEWLTLRQIPRAKIHQYRPAITAALQNFEKLQRDIAQRASNELSKPSSEICK